MRIIGFSTDALALDDFEQGVDLQKFDGIRACELSALREHELDDLIAGLPTLDLTHFHYLSFHAPSSLDELDDTALVEKLQPVLDRRIPIVVHPDIIHDFEPWKQVGDLLLLENMDSRKSVCQTASDLQWFFEQLPQAGFCFDIGHARQIDPTMSVAADLLLRFRRRLKELHISEVNWNCQHVALSSAAQGAYRRVTRLIPPSIPVIIESMLAGKVGSTETQTSINREIASVMRCFATEAKKQPERSNKMKIGM